MKIAILADIHANADALEPVLDKVKRLGGERLFVLGDLVGYHHQPEQTLSLLADWQCDTIKGNHEEILEKCFHDPAELEAITKKYGNGHRKAIEALSEEQLSFLWGLPDTKAVEVDGLRVKLCHGSPWDRDLYVYPDADMTTLERCALDGFDFVFMGHTHHSFVYTRRTCQVLNPGSVGQPRDGGLGAAAWALLDTESRTVRLFRTPYDTTPTRRRALELDPHLPALVEIFQRT